MAEDFTLQEEDFEEVAKPDLIKFCKMLKLDVKGSREQLIERIVSAELSPESQKLVAHWKRNMLKVTVTAKPGEMVKVPEGLYANKSTPTIEKPKKERIEKAPRAAKEPKVEKAPKLSVEETQEAFGEKLSGFIERLGGHIHEQDVHSFIEQNHILVQNAMASA